MAIFNGTSGPDTLSGSASDDQMYGYAGDDMLFGSGGNDLLDGGTGADTLDGGLGDDRFYLDNLLDQIVEASGGGTDILLSSVSYVLADGVFVEGLSTRDWSATDAINLTGNSLANTISGNAGANILDGGAGIDRLTGLGGDDTYYVDTALDRIGEEAGGGNDTVFTTVSYFLADSIFVETLSTINTAATTPINLTGNVHDNTIVGNAGANILDGRGGADIMQGFGGDDIYYVDDALDQVIEAGGGRDEIRTTLASFSMAAIPEVERLSAGSNTAHALTGNALNNRLVGANGNDTLDGGAGNDEMFGGAGNDTYYVDSVLDRALESAGRGTDVVLSSVSYVLSRDASLEGLSTADASATTAINLTGNGLANTISGNAGANILNGGADADVMQGFGGNDRYYVDNGSDQVIEASGQGTDTVLSSISLTLADTVFVEGLSTTNIAGTAAIDLTGNSLDNGISGNAGVNTLNGGGGNDSLVGLGGADTLLGGLGNDALFGGLGADSLTGGAGNDLFRFDSALGGGNVDTVTDFAAVDDTVVLDDAVFTGLSLGVLDANAFVTGAAAGDAGDRIIYNSATGALLFDADGTGGIAAVQFATLQTGLALTASDFVVI